MSVSSNAVRASLADTSSASPASVLKRPHVTVRGLSKRFGSTVIYDKFDLDIPRGELISVFGPNGCGKSTLINMIAGLIQPDAGQILFDGMRLDEIKFGYVFQNYREALFPWLSAFDNIAYPLQIMKVGRVTASAVRRNWSIILASNSI
jgi:NitT/TauT family transport system ATP-binding protein